MSRLCPLALTIFCPSVIFFQMDSLTPYFVASDDRVVGPCTFTFHKLLATSSAYQNSNLVFEGDFVGGGNLFKILMAIRSMSTTLFSIVLCCQNMP